MSNWGADVLPENDIRRTIAKQFRDPVSSFSHKEVCSQVFKLFRKEYPLVVVERIMKRYASEKLLFPSGFRGYYICTKMGLVYFDKDTEETVEDLFCDDEHKKRQIDLVEQPESFRIETTEDEVVIRMSKKYFMELLLSKNAKEPAVKF